MQSFQSLTEIQSALEEGQITLPELVDIYLSNIQNKSGLNAFIEVFESEAREEAARIQKKIESGNQKELAGLIIGVKDNISFKNHEVSAGSNMLEQYSAPYSATAINNLIEQDAIIIGRLNCDEFGMGGSNENSAFGPCLNPFDETRVAGGSSGGSAAAVAANLCHASLGSDTGGSVRQPASFCGVIGLKPTYGQISRHGLVAYASSFDHIGPMTKTVGDARKLFKVMSSTCVHDATSNIVKPDLDRSDTWSFAFLGKSYEDQTQSEIRTGLISLESRLKDDGHTIERIDFPLLDYIVPVYYILTMAEASSNLSRYDGIQFGNRSSSNQDMIEMLKETRSAGFGTEVKRRIMMGNFVLSQEFADAYYNKAQRIRQLIKNQTEKILEKFDFIVSPTAPTTAFKVGEKNKDPLTMYLMDIFTVQANLTGLPAISLPLYKDESGSYLALPKKRACRFPPLVRSCATRVEFQNRRVRKF